MNIFILLAFTAFAVANAANPRFNWHDTVTLHQKKDERIDEEDEGHVANVNVKEHVFDLPAGTHISQADILFRPGEEEKEFEIGTDKRKRDAIRDPRSRWPGAVIHYTIAEANRQAYAAIKDAIEEIQAKTCIRFVKRSNQRNYVRVIAASGCYSYVGRVGGRQDVSIGRGCEYKSTVIHEFMHALGFFHEQSRPDRDNFVKINYGNIISGFDSQFAKQNAKHVTTFNHPYDFKSVMHYERTAFSKSRSLPTIVSKRNANEKLGQPVNGGLTDIDAGQLNAMYCGKSQSTTKSPPSATTKSPPSADRLKEMKQCFSQLKKCYRIFNEL